MFNGIVAERGKCDHCGRPKMVALIAGAPGALPYSEAPAGGIIRLCAGCIYRLTRLAAMLLQYERGATSPKAKKAPKKARKSPLRQPRAIAPHPDVVEHEDDIPVQSDAALHRAGL